MSLKSIFLVLFLVVILFSPAYAEESISWEELAKRPGVTETVQKTDDGKETRTLHFPGGVEFIKNPDGSTMGHDNSENGAVMCAWSIMYNYKSWIEFCNGGVNEERKQFIYSTIDRINDFIVENSLMPITKIDLEEEAKKQSQLYIKSFSEDQRAKICNPEEISKAMESEPLEKWEKEMDKLLSVPRPPVFNPCL